MSGQHKWRDIRGDEKEAAVRRAAEALRAGWEDERACVWIPPEEQLHACRRALDASGVWDALEKRTAERDAALANWGASEERIEEAEARVKRAEASESSAAQRLRELEREITAHEAILMDQSRGAAARQHENERLRDALRWVDNCEQGCDMCRAAARAALASSPSETDPAPRSEDG